MKKVKLDVPGSLKTKITIYDILGNEVKTLFNENLKTGFNEIDTDGLNLPGGVYFYKLETEGFTETKKIIKIK